MAYVKEQGYGGGVFNFPRLYTDDLLSESREHLRLAAAKVETAPEIYRQRVAFVRAGLTYSQLLIETIGLMESYWRKKDDPVATRGAGQLGRNGTTLPGVSLRDQLGAGSPHNAADDRSASGSPQSQMETEQSQRPRSELNIEKTIRHANSTSPHLYKPLPRICFAWICRRRDVGRADVSGRRRDEQHHTADRLGSNGSLQQAAGDARAR